MKYVISWYETNKMMTTSRCKIFVNEQKAIDYYSNLIKTKKDELGHKIRNIMFSKEEVLAL